MVARVAYSRTPTVRLLVAILPAGCSAKAPHGIRTVIDPNGSAADAVDLHIGRPDTSPQQLAIGVTELPVDVTIVRQRAGPVAIEIEAWTASGSLVACATGSISLQSDPPGRLTVSTTVAIPSSTRMAI